MGNNCIYFIKYFFVEKSHKKNVIICIFVKRDLYTKQYDRVKKTQRCALQFLLKSQLTFFLQLRNQFIRISLLINFVSLAYTFGACFFTVRIRFCLPFYCFLTSYILISRTSFYGYSIVDLFKKSSFVLSLINIENIVYFFKREAFCSKTLII